MRGRRFLKVLITAGLCAALLVGGLVLGIDAWMRGSTEGYILSPEAGAGLEDIDCILVLGCGVRADGSPSDMLRDRLTRGVELYGLGAAPKLLMSGDHGRAEYDEVNTMKEFAMMAGVPSSDVFMDHAGFSTYESMYRAKEIFQAERIIIVTQEYHLYRALYTARALGLEAWGVGADYHTYVGQSVRDAREILARVKDFVMVLIRPEPTYLGDAIPVRGDGDHTNDR